MTRLSLLIALFALGPLSCIVVSPDEQDGRLDEYDADGDTYYSYEVGGVDCDDDDASVNPGAEETCDGIDNDCDGGVDESLTTIEFPDDDGDGFGDSNAPTIVCPRTDGYSSMGGDCDDADPAIHPDAPEACDELDNDCDGVADDSLSGTWFADNDGDGYGAGTPQTTCDPSAGLVADNTDCDDTRAESHPGAEEICDGLDNNCEGQADETFGDDAWFEDADGDGYGNPSVAQCTDPGGWVQDSTDCDDTSLEVNPSASDLHCDGVDNDCDGTVDEDSSEVVYPDDDGDGFGDAGRPANACDEPDWITDSSDCDDNDDQISPDGIEACDELDNDCNGAVDDGAPAAFTYYLDGDGDGFGDDSATQDSCGQPAGYAIEGGDCDDTDAAANPGETEVCDGTDTDCNGDIDDVPDDGRDDPCE